MSQCTHEGGGGEEKEGRKWGKGQGCAKVKGGVAAVRGGSMGVINDTPFHANVRSPIIHRSGANGRLPGGLRVKELSLTHALDIFPHSLIHSFIRQSIHHSMHKLIVLIDSVSHSIGFLIYAINYLLLLFTLLISEVKHNWYLTLHEPHCFFLASFLNV